VSPLAGFKAGALNFALRQTAPDAEVVAVIDSDYVVEPELAARPRAAVRRSEIAIVQAPQDYRDADEKRCSRRCAYAEYRGFFRSAWSRATSATPSSSTAR
jgi:cellulose synthase/poly-beta-1,6-N-acetylglucosamine synthase-like glycosyltransferase